MKHCPICLIITTLVIFCASSFAAQDGAVVSRSETLNRLDALARTFGYVRYFHPSDQAALVDWEAMAYFATQKVFDSENDRPNSDVLMEIFDPIVVDLEFYQGAEKPRPETKPADINQIVAWQHYGVGISDQGLYRSVRTNRIKQKPTPPSPFANVIQRIDPAALQGQEIRYRFDARIEEGECRLQGWYRVDLESGKVGLFDNMGKRPITGSEWAEYELTGTVNEDAKDLLIGVMFMGNGSALIDNVRLELKNGDQWKAVEIGNPDFEMDDKKIERWVFTGDGYMIKPTTDDAARGKLSARIGRGSARQTGGLFELVPEQGEVVDASIGKDLRIRMPLTLSVDAVYQPGDKPTTDKLLGAIADSDVESADDRTQCIANVILAWNTFQHFYPYFGQVDCDWNAVLTQALERAIQSSSREQTLETLQWMVAQLHDGHGMVFDVASMREMQIAPVKFDWIENQLVVTASDQAEIKVGDIVSKIGNVAAVDYLAQREELISGSPQWIRFRSTQQLSQGKEPLALTLKRGGKDVAAELKYEGRKQATVDKGDICRILVDGKNDDEDIWYIDLGRAEPKDVNDKIDKFSTAKGIVLDLRGYPRGTQYLFQHMTDQHMQSQQWQVPKQVRPDRVDMKEIETIGRWEMPPREPRFRGKMVFITNGSAISYAESCMAIVANYKLGEIIGSSTAGANGNVNPFSLPGDFRVSWTGMRVMNHDDSQHHVRGVQPTIPMQPTIKGIVDGKDELLEKAIEVIAGT